MFELLITATFAKELKKLQRHEIERIKEKLKSTQENPMLFFEGLKGTELYKLRVGKFRILATINFREKTITMHSLGLRKNVYDRLQK